ncbi:Astra associated protein 1 Asa1 [Podospora pseudopauciseta]|uniref:ASTRA-associated protein 1 n=1 Tax=Podospora pseudopauciseta TaxID=2093780 RepID=A0ABR0HFM1_9PEZI|nr:Astra associated protein 1 Asa1 [Podospora pseudopauciseta]
MASNARPAQPKTILRGHKTPVQVAAFVRNNERLLTGDSDGFVVAWDLTIMRPRAVWQAHTASILGIAGWGHDRIITHGRDNRLVVWKLTAEHENVLSTSLPLDPSSQPRPKPWMLHVLQISTMNFCSFSYCPAYPDTSPAAAAADEILLAVPNTLSSESIDIFHLPSLARKHTVGLPTSSSPDQKNGMAMSLSLFHHPTSHHLTLVAGYERGLAAVYQLDPNTSKWAVTYQSNPHTQPILSLDVSPDESFFLSSGADATIAKHPIPSCPPSSGIIQDPILTINTRHAGQQSLRIRSDNLIFATAGWDSMVRVYSVKTMKELAVLKWHQQGCYAVAFAAANTSPTTSPPQEEPPRPDDKKPEGSHSKEVTTQVPKMLVEQTPKQKRLHQARTARWLAAGSKDGRVSLWDVY